MALLAFLSEGYAALSSAYDNLQISIKRKRALIKVLKNRATRKTLWRVC